MDLSHPEDAAKVEPPSQTGEPVRRRTALWRAVAGMAAALALASAIVAVEMSEELVTRIRTYRYRIASLNKKVDRLKREAAADEKSLADAREEIATKDRIKAILLAPDLKKIRLIAPNSASVAAGNVSLSRKMSGAVLTAHGLPPPLEGEVYDAWWILKNAPPAKAAEFESALDGTASIYLDPPPQGSTAIECTITLEPSPGGIEPAGDVRLKGRIYDERNAVTARP